MDINVYTRVSYLLESTDVSLVMEEKGAGGRLSEGYKERKRSIRVAACSKALRTVL